MILQHNHLNFKSFIRMSNINSIYQLISQNKCQFYKKIYFLIFFQFFFDQSRTFLQYKMIFNELFYFRFIYFPRKFGNEFLPLEFYLKSLDDFFMLQGNLLENLVFQSLFWTSYLIKSHCFVLCDFFLLFFIYLF